MISELDIILKGILNQVLDYLINAESDDYRSLINISKTK